MKMRQTKLLIHVAAALGLATGSSAALAYDVWLRAESFSKAMPDATSVTMWGYSACGTGFTGCGAPTSPGPQITVPTTESSLTIHLRNNLAVPTSIVIPGQPAALSPVKVGGRVEAFTSEVAAGGTGTYTWNGLQATGLRPGTFLYQSGSHVQLQVQMGLYGALVHDVGCAPLTCAYAGVPYENQQVLVFSEVDPSLHDPTPKPVNATAGGYAPRYFLINGEATPPAGPAVAPGSWLLLRMVNAGLENHAPELLGGYFDIVAEDGNAISPLLRRRQYSALLPAAKSLDVIFAPGAAASYPLFDRRLRLENDDATGGGMRTSIATDGAAVNRPNVGNDTYTTLEDTPINLAAPGVLANDDAGLAVAFHSDPAKATLTLNGDGSMAFTPKPNLNGTDVFTYRGIAGSTATNAAVVTVNITPVNDAPVAGDDVYLVDRNVLATGNGNNPTGTYTFQVAAPGVLGNDTDVDVNTTLSALNRSAVTIAPAQAGIVPSALATNGSFSVAFNPSSPNTNAVRQWVGYATFTYDACDLLSGATCAAAVSPDASHADQGAAVIVKDARVRAQQAGNTFVENGGVAGQRTDIVSATSSSRYIQNEAADSASGFPQQLRVWDLKTELRPLTGLSAATPLVLAYYLGGSAASPLIGTCSWTGAGSPTCTPGAGASLAANGTGASAALQNATCSQASTVACRMRIALPNGSALIPSGTGTASITLVATVPATGTTIPAHSVTMPGVVVPIHN